MDHQDKKTNSSPAQSPEPDLQSTRGTGDVLGGYRAPGDARHHDTAPEDQHDRQNQPTRADAKAEQALDHEGGYDKWGGKEKPQDDAGKQSPKIQPKSSGQGDDSGPPAGHYGDAEMGGQGKVESGIPVKK